MNTGRHRLTIGVTVLVVLAVVLYACARRPARSARREQLAALRERAADLSGQVQRLQKTCAALAQAVHAQSNRADVAEQLYAEEKETHDPLRRQIEQMIAEEIRYKAEVRQQDDDLKAARDALGKAEKQVQTLQAKADALTKRVTEMENARQALEKTQKELNQELGAAGQQSKALEKQVADAQAVLKRTQDQLKAANQLNAKLQKEIEALKAGQAKP
jgi:chromosome segregation ATPase